MTTVNEAKQAVLSRWITEWDDRTPYTFDNRDFDAPNEDWCRVTVRNQESNQETLGRVTNRRYLRRGVLFVQIFTLVGTGTLLSDGHVQRVREIFEGVSFDGLRFFDAVHREIGQDGKFYQANVVCAFDYEERK
jgi:hypothetical protein